MRAAIAMRLAFPCLDCFAHKQATGEPMLGPVYGELNDDGAAVGICDRGHKVTMTLQQPRHEILFDWACLAFADAYNREAVASFAASLERFHETALRVLCSHLKMSGPAFEKTWKVVSNHSERQLGAVLFLYEVHTGKELPRLPQRLVELRNEAVHKGKFVSHEQAEAFGEFCYTCIHAMARELAQACPEAWQGEFFREALERQKRQPNGAVQSSNTSPAYTIYERPEPLPFADALAAFLQHNQWRRGPAPG
jgi:hypothetical protein